MRSLHPASLALGLVFGSISLVSIGQVPTLIGPKIEVLAHPRDFVQIQQGVPYTVPSSKLFVLTGLGTDLGTTYTGTVSLLVNDQQICASASASNVVAAPMSVASMASTRTVSEGSVISVSASNPALSGRVWGYLVAVQSASVGSDSRVRVPYMPSPRDAVELQQGSPFVVPSGKLFVLTALGGSRDGGDEAGTFLHALKVNGQTEVTAVGTYAYVLSPLASAPIGFAVTAGTVVEPVQIAGSVSPSRAWGYIAPQ